MTFLWFRFLVSVRQRKRTRFCFFYRAGLDKRRFPLRGTERGSEECKGYFEPFGGVQNALSDERVEKKPDTKSTGLCPAAEGFRSLRRKTQVGSNPDAARPRCGRAAPRATRRFLCPAFFGSDRQRKRAGFCSFWPESKRRRAL